METAFLTSDYDISNIRMRKETFGGATYDLGCYNTSLIFSILGREPDAVKAVASFSDRGIDKFTTALLEFGNVKASMNCGMVLATEKGFRFDRTLIGGTKGLIVTNAEYNGCGEQPHVSKDFSLANSRIIKQILDAIGY